MVFCRCFSGELAGTAMGTRKLTIILPDDLHARLVSQAERERRSLHGQMLYLLESGAWEPVDERAPHPIAAQSRRIAAELEMALAHARALAARLEAGGAP